MTERKRRGRPARRTYKTVRAILKAERKHALRPSELTRLLDAEWSRCIRERDRHICQITGKLAYPGVQPGMGNAAHLIPKSQAPFHLKYDLRNGIWMEWLTHMEFDGLLAGRRRPARQSYVWGVIARTRPEVFEYLTSQNWRGDEKPVSVHTMRAKLEELRRTSFLNEP